MTSLRDMGVQERPRPGDAPSITPDFTRWSRANLEKMATDLNNENLQLKADLRLALDNYRSLLKQHNAHRPIVPF